MVRLKELAQQISSAPQHASWQHVPLQHCVKLTQLDPPLRHIGVVVVVVVVGAGVVVVGATQVPPWQVPAPPPGRVQAVPSGLAGLEQAPVVGSHAPRS
jgi:hypothetical protein